MAGAEKIKANHRAKKAPPFATFHCDFLLACACSLPPTELAIMVLLNANMVMAAKGSNEAVLAYSVAVADIRRGSTAMASRKGIAAAFRGLKAKGLIQLVRAGVRPGSQGSARRGGKAAVWRLPYRMSTTPRLEWPPHLQAARVRKPDGKVRLYSSIIRSDVRELTSSALRVLLYAISMRPRMRDGTLRDMSLMVLSPMMVAEHTSLSRASAARALAELVEKGRIAIVEHGAGRRPASYSLHKAYVQFDHWPAGAPAYPMVSSRGLLARRKGFSKPTPCALEARSSQRSQPLCLAKRPKAAVSVSPGDRQIFSRGNPS